MIVHGQSTVKIETLRLSKNHKKIYRRIKWSNFMTVDVYPILNMKLSPLQKWNLFLYCNMSSSSFSTETYKDSRCTNSHTYFCKRRIQRRRAGRPPPLLFKIFYECIFWNFNFTTRINFIVINMQCLLYVFYSLLSLQKHRVCVKGHQNNFQTSKIIPRRDRAPRF